MATTNDTLTAPAPAPLATPSDIAPEGVAAISEHLRGILADAFALYVKTKNFHWHVSGTHFRDYHRMLDEQAAEILATTDEIAERARKIGGTTIRSIGDISRNQSISDNDQEFVAPLDMLRELCVDNQTMTRTMRKAHDVCDEHHDVATASFLENLIDLSEKRTWFLYETVQRTQNHE